jgi:transforming growth factor-beta-induced protein
MKLIKKMNQMMAIVLLLMATLIVSSCDNEDEDPILEPLDNIVTIAQGNSDLTSLVTALVKYPDLVSTLQGGEFTVFAPTNAAFEAVLAAVGQSSVDDLPEAVLRSILEYHVVANATIRSTDLSNGTATTVQGEDITINVDGGVTFNGSATVVAADVDAQNGIIHVIDQVLVMPSVTPIVGTIVAPAYFNKNFTTLIAAVQAASPGILTTLLNSDEKTLFAPTNDAFAAAGITELPDQATLDAVLTYHVIGAKVEAADIAEGSSTAATLGGDIYLSNNGANGLFINGTTSVTTADIAGSNGVVHVIDRTLLPASESIADIAIMLSGADTPEFTQLVAALVKVPSLLEAAQSEGNLTVFAPTDAAFQALYDALEVADLDALEAAITTDKLAEVLQHHIVGARVFSTDLSSGAVGTLNQDITVDLDALSIVDANGSDPANLVTSSLNILATNGVIHVIDRVLIPTGIL